MNWEDLTDVYGCGANVIAELENDGGLSELFDTGSYTMEIPGSPRRTFVVSLHVEEVTS